MPKSGKKNKDKAADFSKAKLRLGKGKQVANNATDTSFKARSIALPRQGITIQKDDSAPTTRRNLSLDDLIIHLKHYSANARKDALAGLKELLGANTNLIEPSLNTLVNACVRLIADEDALVRKTLLSFLSWLLPLVPRASLAPHTSLIMLFTTSALSHIFPEIRVDAVRFVDLLLTLVPKVVVSGWTDAVGVEGDMPEEARAESSAAGSQHGRRVLNGYLALFELKGKKGEKAPVGSSSSLTLSANSKLILLKSFCHFLRVSISRQTGDADTDSSLSPRVSLPTWFFASSFATPAAYQSFVQSLESTRALNAIGGDHNTRSSMTWQPVVNPLLEESDENFPGEFSIADADGGLASWSLDDLSIDSNSNGSARDEQKLMPVAELALKMHSVLVATFLDSAPGVVAPSGMTSGTGTDVELIGAAGQIAGILYGALLTSGAMHTLPSETRAQLLENLRILLGYMAPYFPFDAESIQKRDLKSEQLLQDLSLAYCELTSILVIASSNSRGWKPKDSKALDAQAQRVGEYVVQALQGQLVTVSQPMGRVLSASAYAALLPTIWCMINTPEAGDIASTVLDSTLEHAMRISTNSGVKRLASEFVARLYLVHTEPMYRGEFGVGQGQKVFAAFSTRFADWALGLPRLLWELGTRDLAFTEMILLFLLRISQRRRSFLGDFVMLRQRLVPFFTVEHPSKGLVPGPYVKISAHAVRRLALDAVVSASLDGQTDELMVAVDRTVRGTLEEAYWHTAATR